MSILKNYRVVAVIMTVAILFTSLPALTFSVSAGEYYGGNGNIYEYSEGYNSPGAKAEASKSRGEFGSVPVPPTKISTRAVIKGEQNGTNYSFVVPVSHRTNVPDGWEAIESFSDFDKIRDNPNGNFILIGDKDGRFDMENYNYSSVGSFDEPFTGIFDGNGYVIENLNITSLPDSQSYVAGLFGAINGATIKNLGIANLTINIENDAIQSIGSIAGASIGSVIENCFNNGTVVNVYPSREVTDAGGIVGSTWNTIVRSSFNTGYVGTDSTGTGLAQTAGGIAGGSYFAGTDDEGSQSTQLFSVIENCYNEGYVSAHDDAGGVIGEIFGHVMKSYNSGYVYGGSYAGGLVGSGTYGHYINEVDENGDVKDPENVDNLKPGNKLVNCYNTGEVKTDDVTENLGGGNILKDFGSAGGLVGLMVTLSIESCYNSNSQNTDPDYYGGLVATNVNALDHPSIGEIINSYYSDGFNDFISYIDTSDFYNFVSVNNVQSETLEEMTRESLFEGFDFGGIWTIDEDNNTPELLIFANDYVKLSGNVYYPGNDEEYVLSGNKVLYEDIADITIRFWSDKVGALYDFKTQSDENGYYEIWILPLENSPTTVIASASGFSTYAFNEIYGEGMFEPGTNDGRAENEEEQRWIYDYDIFLHRGVIPPPDLVLKGFTSYTQTKINQVTGAVEYMTPMSLGGVRIDVESYYDYEDPETGEITYNKPYVYTTYSSYATGTKNSAFNARFFAGDIKITASKDGFINTYIYKSSDKKIDGLDMTLTAMFDDILIPMEINRIEASEDGRSGNVTPVENTSGFGFSLTNTSQGDQSLIYTEDFTVTSRLNIDYNHPFWDADTGEIVGYKSEPDGFYLSVSGKSVRTEIQRDKYIGGTLEEGNTLKLEVMDNTGKIQDNVKEDSFELKRIKDRDNPPEVKTLIFNFDSQGYWIAEDFDSTYEKGMALIFNDEDNFVERAVFNPATGNFKSAELVEGTYTVVFIEIYPNMRNPLNMSYLDDNQYAYVTETVEIRDGYISRIGLTDTLPVIDKNFEYLDLARTSIKFDKYRGFPNMQVMTTIDFAVNQNLLQFVDTNERVNVTIDLTGDFSIYNNFVKLDGKKLVKGTDYEMPDDKTITVFVPVNDITGEGVTDISGTIKIGLITETEGMQGISASVNFTRDDGGFSRAASTQVSRLIGSVEFMAYEIDITNLPENPPASTTEDEFRITGTATPYTWVKVMVNGVEQQPSVKADSSGNWKKLIMLDYDLVTAEYKITATNGKGQTGEHTLIHIKNETVELPQLSTIDVASGYYSGDYAIVWNSTYGYWEYDYSQFHRGYYNDYYYNTATDIYEYRMVQYGDYELVWNTNGYWDYDYSQYHPGYYNEYYYDTADGTYKYRLVSYDTSYYETGKVSFDYTNPYDRGYKTLYNANYVPYRFNVKLDDTSANTAADKVFVYAKDVYGRDVAVIELSGSGEDWEAETNFDITPYYNFYGYIDNVYVRYGSERGDEYIDGEYCFITSYYDPAGYVYEAVESNRVEGVTTTLYEADLARDENNDIIEDGNEGGRVNEDSKRLWVDTNEEDPQPNGQKTDSEGKYAYQVGLGAYMVKFSKDGYETRWNNTDTLHERADDWLIVPPMQTEVNVGMRSTEYPEVIGAVRVKDDLGQEYVVVNFSQYMNVETLLKAAGNVTMKVNGESAEDFGITFMDGENAAADDEISPDRFYAKTMEIWLPDGMGLPGSFQSGDEVEITISGNAKNYRDYTLGEDWTATVTFTTRPSRTLKVTAPMFDMVMLDEEDKYTQPEAKVITIENEGSEPIDITSVTVSPDDAFIIEGIGVTVEGGETITTWTIQPKAGLKKGIYNAEIRVAYDNTVATASVIFEVEGIITPSFPIIKEVVEEDGVKYNYISGLDAGSDGITAADFTALLTVKDGYTVEVINKDGEEITDKIYTGTILQVKDALGVIVEVYTLVVKYDVTGTGKAGLSDIFSVLDYSVGNVTFDNAQILAIKGDKKGLSLVFDMIDYAVGNQ